MNTVPDIPRSATGGRADDALLRAVADMSPGWTVLRNCAVNDGDRGARARVRYALLHPDVGIALLDVLPGPTTPGAPDRLRRLLDAAGFRAAFGDYPPVVYICVPSRSLFGLDTLLAREFDLLPPLGLAGGDAWVGAVQGVLTSEPPLGVPGRMAARGPLGPTRWPHRWRGDGQPAPQPGVRLRGLAVFWGAVALVFGGGALVLHNLGPPEEASAVARAGGAGPGEPQGSPPGSEAWLTPSHPDKARLPSAGPIFALWPAERMPTRLGAGRAGAAAPRTDDVALVDHSLDGDQAPTTEPAAPDRPQRPSGSGATPAEADQASGAERGGYHASAIGGASARPSVGGTMPPAEGGGTPSAPAPVPEALPPVPQAFFPNAAAKATGGWGEVPAAFLDGSATDTTVAAAGGARRLAGGTRDQIQHVDATGAPAEALPGPVVPGPAGSGFSEGGAVAATAPDPREATGVDATAERGNREEAPPGKAAASTASAADTARPAVPPGTVEAGTLSTTASNPDTTPPNSRRVPLAGAALVGSGASPVTADGAAVAGTGSFASTAAPEAGGQGAAATDLTAGGPGAPSVPDPGAASPAQADAPAGAAETPSATDFQDAAHTDPRSTRAPEGGTGGADAAPRPGAVEPVEVTGVVPSEASPHDSGSPSAYREGVAPPPATAAASQAMQPSADPEPGPAAPTSTGAEVPSSPAAVAATPPASTGLVTDRPGAAQGTAGRRDATSPGDGPAAAWNVAPPAQPSASVPVARPVSPNPEGKAGAVKADEAERRAPATVSLPPALVEALVARGDAMVARRDISAARLLYERAAAAGDARAASAMAKTYDPAFLAEIGARGIGGDAELATAWYRRAISLGDGSASARVEALNGPDRGGPGRP